MGKKPAEVEQEIREVRSSISAKVEEMTNRVEEDVAEVRERVAHSLDGTPFKASLAERPFVTLAGALGLGVVLGMASESIKLGRSDGPSTNNQRNAGTDNGGGLSSGIFGGVVAGLEGAVIEEGKQLIHEWLAPSRRNRESADPTRSNGSVPAPDLEDTHRVM